MPDAQQGTVPTQVLKVLGTIVAPATVLTALMYYFGFLHAYWFFRSFGVEHSVFGLTTQDYLVRSADGLFVPLTVLAVLALVVVWSTRLVPLRISPARQVVAARVGAAVSALCGVGLLAVAASGVLDPVRFVDHVTVPGLALTVGTLLLFGASRLQRRWSRRGWTVDGAHHPVPFVVAAAEWMSVFVLASVGLFWAAGNYSAAVGTQRATQVAQALTTWPDAVLYTEKSLNLTVPGVVETRCAQSDAAQAFRYTGLHLVIQSGGRYLFLPEGWTARSGTAVVIAADDGMRLEFSSGAAVAPRC